MRNGRSHWLNERFLSLYRNRHLYNLLLAIAIGVLSGYGAVVFKFVIKGTQWLFYQNTHDFLDFAAGVPWYLKIAIPGGAGIVVGLIIHFFAREAKGHGVPEVMMAIALRSGIIRKRVAAAKIVASAITIGSGGSVGREGPMVQIGSSIGSSIGQIAKVPTADMRTMVGCGAAAGIAATFNAPIAGVLFALEIIVGDFGVTSFSPVVLSSVTATTISRYYFGDFPTFIIPSYAVVSHWEYLLYPVLGVVTGLVALSFTSSLYWFEDRFDDVTFVPEWVKPAIGGALLGVIVIWFPQVFGVGFGSMNLALTNQLGFWALFLCIWLKILATSVTLGGGGSGGIFAPSLYMGVMTGGAFGHLVNWLFPALTASPGAYALVAMGGLVAGTTYAPITAILIIFELTGDYSIILPLMLTCIVAAIMNSFIRRDSIYTIKLRRRGIDLMAGRERTLLGSIPVSAVMDREVVRIPESATLEAIIHAFKEDNAPYLHVVNADGILTGIISFRDIRPLLGEEALLPLIIARDIATKKLVTVTPQNTLQDAMQRFAERGVSQLPVVRSGAAQFLEGTLTERAAAAAYDRAVRTQEIEQD